MARPSDQIESADPIFVTRSKAEAFIAMIRLQELLGNDNCLNYIVKRSTLRKDSFPNDPFALITNVYEV